MGEGGEGDAWCVSVLLSPIFCAKPLYNAKEQGSLQSAELPEWLMPQDAQCF